MLAQLHSHGVTWESERVTRRRHVAARRAGDTRGARRFALQLSRARRSHLPDALIWPSDQSRQRDLPIAVEVELSQKSAARLKEILSGYATSRDVAGVVYICAPRCHRAVLMAAEHRPCVSVTTLEEFGHGIALPPRPGRKPFDSPRPRTRWSDRWLTPGWSTAIESEFDQSVDRWLHGDSTSRCQLSLDI